MSLNIKAGVMAQWVKFLLLSLMTKFCLRTYMREGEP